MDITNFITWFINQILNIFTWCFNLLNEITFYNISLLQYIISLLVLGVIIEILFTLVTSNGIGSSREYMKKEERKKEIRETREARSKNGK